MKNARNHSDRSDPPKPKRGSGRGAHRWDTADAAPAPQGDDAIDSIAAGAGDDIDVEVLDEDDELFGEGADHRRFLIKRDVRRRLDKYLLDRLKGISRNRIQKLIDLGGVKVNERQPKASTPVLKGDVIDVILPAPAVRTIEPEAIPLHVLYEDEFFIVVNKQAGLIVHPARSHLKGTLLNGLAHHFKVQREAAGGTFEPYATRGFRTWKGQGPRAKGQGTERTQPDQGRRPRAFRPDAPSEEPVTVEGLSEVGAAECRPGVVHRLDKFTTGVMVVAKNDEAHWGIARQFEDRTTTKAYLALVHGNFDAASGPGGVVNEPIGKHPTIREAFAIRRDSYGKPSVTIYRVREQYQGYSLVELELKTGRTHQIRVHMSYIGHPIMGDLVYGGEAIGEKEIEHPPVPAGGRKFMTFARTREDGLALEEKARQRTDLILTTPALHAALLSFTHPMTQQVVRFAAPLHEPMRSLVARLRQRPAAGPVAESGFLVDLNEAVS